MSDPTNILLQSIADKAREFSQNHISIKAQTDFESLALYAESLMVRDITSVEVGGEDRTDNRSTE